MFRLRIGISILLLICFMGVAFAQEPVRPRGRALDPQPGSQEGEWWGFELALAIIPFTVDKGNDIFAFEGVTFPVYIGYLTFTEDKRVVFTKTTDVPIPHIEKFFKEIESTGWVRPVKKTYLPLYDPVSVDGEYFFDVLMAVLEQERFIQLNMSVLGDARKYTYIPQKTCVFIPGKQTCSEREFIRMSNFIRKELPQSQWK